MARRRRGPGSRFGAVLPVLFLVGAFAGACESDTLYEPTGPDPVDPTDPNGPEPTPGVELSIALDVPDRIELTDSLRIQLEALDPSAASGIQRLGYTLVVTLADGSRQAVTGETTFPASTPAGDTVSHSVTLAPTWLSSANVPAGFELQAYGYAFNRAGDCRAAVPDAPGQDFSCALTEVGSQSYRISSTRAQAVPILAVAGRTTRFPTASIVVGDLVVDHARGNVFISNRQANHLHVFRPGDFAFTGNVAVGSEPWGLHLNRTGDTLLVANSGGTSISHVALSAGGGQEIYRLQTRNSALFEVDFPDAQVNRIRFVDFSDRPQYVAQDADGRILYSTRPTLEAPRGTVQIIENRPGWEEPHTKLLVRLPDDVTHSGSLAIAHVDSIIGFLNGDIEIFDHVPGYPSQVIRSGRQPILAAAQYMRDNTASDIEFLDPTGEFGSGSSWMLDNVVFSDTTYVAVSGDRNHVAFGDGGQPDVGRIVVWNAPAATITARLPVADLTNNASERVRAISLTEQGGLGVARGAFGTYFFSPDLRLRGTVAESFPGGGGAAFHPQHPNVAPSPGGSSLSSLAFTISGDRTIRILDTVHYLERGSIPIRDALAGPMRISPPLASDNNGQGSSCTGPDCVVAKIYAVTEAGGVVVVDVRASHIGSVP